MHSYMKRVRLRGLTTAVAFTSLLSVFSAPMAAAQTPPEMRISDVAVSEGGNAVFTVQVRGQHPNLSVDYRTHAGTADETADYALTTGTLTIAANSNSGEISVPTVQETTFEPDERFFVDLDRSSTIANVVDNTGEGTISNEDPVPQIDIDDTSVTENDDAVNGVDALFNVRLTNPASVPVTVQFRTADGTAIGSEPLNFGRDFRDREGTLEFPAGDNATRQIRVKVLGDTKHEGNETLLVNLSNPVNARLGDSQAVGTIVENDPIPTLSIEDEVVTEGDAETKLVVLTVSLSNLSSSDVQFVASTANDSALAGVDYVELPPTTKTIQSGSVQTTVAVTINGDNVFGLDKQLFVIIDNPTNAVLGDSVGTLTIDEDDPFVFPDLEDLPGVDPQHGEPPFRR
jgi:Calx-beta domain